MLNYEMKTNVSELRKSRDRARLNTGNDHEKIDAWIQIVWSRMSRRCGNRWLRRWITSIRRCLASRVRKSLVEGPSRRFGGLTRSCPFRLIAGPIDGSWHDRVSEGDQRQFTSN